MSQRPSHSRSQSSLSTSSGRSIGTAPPQASVPNSQRGSTDRRPSLARSFSQASTISLPLAPQKTALLIVDVQNDFLPEGVDRQIPTLAVAGSDKILGPIRDLLDVSNKWEMVVISQDWHPPGHISFRSRHQRSAIQRLSDGREYVNMMQTEGIKKSPIKQLLWPDHCIMRTWGAAVESSIKAACDVWKTKKRLAYVRKGAEMHKDAYSAFGGRMVGKSIPRLPLADYLISWGITQLVICGIATDVCAAATATDALQNGFDVIIPRDAVRGVNDATSEAALRKLRKEGALILSRGDEVAGYLWY